MSRDRSGALAIATFGISVILAVPAFAQSAITGPRVIAMAAESSEADRSGTNVARIFDANALWDSGTVLPPNLIVPDGFRRVVESMLHGSATFRRQCLRLANAPHMTVVLDWFRPAPAERLRARTVLSVTPDGQRRAMVGIRALDDPIELIAHEIEHVIEQLDEVDLRTRAAVPASGVHGCDCAEEGGFETVRATRTGRAVAEEVRRNGT